MDIDQDRIHSILTADLSYYGSRKAVKRVDGRLTPFSLDYPERWFLPEMHVLDLGCGSGETLLAHSSLFHTGMGIDNDPEHIQLAEDGRRERGITNVEFQFLEFPREIERLPGESFDFVFSERGAIYPDSSESLRAALSLLKPDGLIFCEEIGELHLKEVDEIFGTPAGSQPTGRLVEKIRSTMESCGISIRLVADIFSKWYYPDVYEWLFWQCSLWTWLRVPLPEADDPRIIQFAEKTTTATGEIETTHHVVWVAGIKR